MNVRAERFPLFDSLRAIAALSVLAFHASFFAGAFTSDSPIRPYTARLDVGVTVFFLISGFLLYRPFVVARLHDLHAPRVTGYAWRRFLRIVPAYWVALTVVALWLSIDGVFSARHGPLYYGFAQIYSPTTALGGIAQAWTLCVEVTFYAFLPLWGLAMRRASVRAELIALGALFAASVAWKGLAVHEVDPSSLQAAPWVMPLPNFLDQFAVGMALAVLSVRYAEGLPRALALVERRPWLAWLASAVAFWIVATRIGLEGRLGERFDGAQFIGRHELYTVVALGIVLPAIFGWSRRDPIRRLLGLRPLLYVGLVSYAVYLWHYALILKLARGINDTLTEDLGLGLELRVLVYFVLGAACAVGVATLSYQLIERPALRLKRLVAPPAEEQRGEATAEPAPATPTAS